ncbi:hypothetical protein DRM25_22780 [Salmonella enterica subsp. houtenae]|nr:hypothetical protein [Salmonella enterica subsp. houtenae]ECI4807737.1 hypothetical protein [Salmonella enterica subsp. houtenae]
MNYINKGIGYAFGVFVVVPVVIYVVNFLFFHGNKVTQEQVTQYINDSRIIEVFIPRVTMLDVKLENSTDGNMVEDGSRLDSEKYRIKLSRKDNLKRIKRFIFYSKKYNRYMMLINFDGFDYGGPYNFDLNDDRNSVIFSGRYFMVRINNKQWGDVRYGSEKNRYQFLVSR